MLCVSRHNVGTQNHATAVDKNKMTQAAIQKVQLIPIDLYGNVYSQQPQFARAMMNRLLRESVGAQVSCVLCPSSLSPSQVLFTGK